MSNACAPDPSRRSLVRPRGDGANEDLKVAEETAVLHVVDGKAHLLQVDQFEVSAVRVRMAAQDLAFVRKVERSGSVIPGNREEELLFIGVSLHSPGHLRAWSDETHVAEEDVPELDSSTLYRRIHRPSAVMRGSSSAVEDAPIL
jgi:hypothetical protein